MWTHMSLLCRMSKSLSYVSYFDCGLKPKPFPVLEGLLRKIYETLGRWLSSTGGLIGQRGYNVMVHLPIKDGKGLKSCMASAASSKHLNFLSRCTLFLTRIP